MTLRAVVWALVLAWVLWRLLGRPRPPAGRRAGPPPPPPAEDPWAVLGVARGASTAEVRRAYQRAVADYHPDQVAHLGEDLRRLAEQRTKAITAAYARLRGRR